MTNEKTLDEEVVGMFKYDAIIKIEAANFKARISAEEGEEFIVTMDYNPERFNLEIVDGKVVKVSRG